MTVKNFDTEFDFIPWCSEQQNADARAYVERMAPDLLDVIFGEAS